MGEYDRLIGAHLVEWLRAVATLADDDTADRPPQAAVVAVAAVRVGYANYDGRACRPSQQTVAQAAGVKRQRVREVDRFLVARGFLKVVRPGSRTAPIEYGLVLPVDDLIVVEAVDNGPDNGLEDARRLLTRAEVAELLATTERHVKALSTRGDIPVVRVGRLVRYDLADVTDYVNRCREGGRVLRHG